MSNKKKPDIKEIAEAWQRVDPDPETSGQLKNLLEGGESDMAADGTLEELFSGRLSFGTAGLRAELGPGPMKMNRVLVQMVTRALFEVLEKDMGKQNTGKQKGQESKKPKIVVGYDARKNSDIFAQDAAGVIEEMGGTAVFIGEPLPTPVLAYSVLNYSAEAGIMVTASHNPREDNGYKAYWSDGAQIAPPNDRLVEHIFSKLLEDPASFSAKDYSAPATNVAESALADYLSALAGELAPAVPIPKDLKVVYTPMHGVGKKAVEMLFEELGFPKPLVVPEQAEPDGSFPTAAYPNPEEPGAMDLALALAVENNADLILANDPDADRLAVALPVPLAHSSEKTSEWRNLTGNEIGILLADYCMDRAAKNTGGDAEKSLLLATTCVSSQLLGKMAEARGIQYEETLTGFKWIARADQKEEYEDTEFIFGYEEALGYSVLPRLVRDKDGVSAAAAFVNLYLQLAAENKTPLDRLEELAKTHGLHLTSAASIRYEGTDAGKAAEAMGFLRHNLPTQIGGIKVVEILDYSEGKNQRPSNMLSFYLENKSRIVIRPSGTEPKLKVYVELVEGDPSKKAEAEAALKALTDSAARLIARE